MAPSFLTVDLGNSSCKLRLFDNLPVSGRAAAGPRAALDLPAGHELLAQMGDWLAGLARPAAAALSCVSDPLLQDELAEGLGTLVKGPVLVHPDPGLENTCDHPETVGMDRLYGARAALERCGVGAIVVDAGTALTVDAAAPAPQPSSGSARSGPARGRFLGGAIAPGPALLARALSARGARLPDFVSEPGAAALGRDTIGALRGGIAVGFRGAAAELVRSVAREAELAGELAAPVPVILTGGARGFLLLPTPFVEGELLVAPDLVHEGLWHAAACLLAGRASADRAR